MSGVHRGGVGATGRGLTPRQEHFAQLVSSGECSQADAYRLAYPTSLKWKAESVHEKASRLAADSKVKARIEPLRRAAADKAGLHAADVIAELKKLAFSDIGNIMWPDGRVKLPQELDPSTRATIKKFKIDELGRIEYEFWSKDNALDRAFRHLGLYEKDNEQQAGGLIALRNALQGRVIGANPSAAQPDGEETPD